MHRTSATPDDDESAPHPGQVGWPPGKLRFPTARGELELAGLPKVMGIVNITPDSFSDGGQFFAADKAIGHGLTLAAEGVHILDLGAESTRPGGGVYGKGSRELEANEELDRLLPVLEPLRARLPSMPISVDTRKGKVAEAALRAGADMINDVGGLRDPELRAAVATSGCPVIAMHSRGKLSSMQREIRFDDAVAEVRAELEAMLEQAQADGIPASQVVLDPGIGFGKKRGHNLALIRHVGEFHSLGCPLLIGASRKSFIAAIHPAPPSERLPGSLATLAWAARCGVHLVRVHDVAASRQFLEVWSAIDSA